MIELLRKKTPWVLKCFLKIILHKIPNKERLLRKFIFRWGNADVPSIAYNTYYKHFSTTFNKMSLVGKIVLELGPGDAINAAIFFYFIGADKIYLVDNGKYVSANMNKIYEFIDYLEEHGKSFKYREIVQLKNCNNIDKLLVSTNSQYLTNGLSSLVDISSDCVDFIFSNVVLEHIFLNDFIPEVKELYRITKPGGISSHTIDYRDHLSESIYSLKFSRKIWETDLVRSSGFYTNRLRHKQVLGVLKRSGFTILKSKITLYDKEKKISNIRINSIFKNRADLNIALSHVVLQKNTTT